MSCFLPPLAAELERIAQQFARPEIRQLEEGKAPEGEEQAFQRILQLLRNQSGLEVRQYKPQTIRRRMARRMLLLRMETLADYHRFLQTRPEEVHALQEDILINVTRFFRDPGFWEALKDHVLPALLQDRPGTKPVRIWCAGCSTGEEAYYLAITVLEYITTHGLDTPVQIFGTDASERSIQMARTAVYDPAISVDLGPERLRRYFINVDNGYQVSKRVRDICIFARQNLCNDPPFSHMDIVSCRNVMIYFNQALQVSISRPSSKSAMRATRNSSPPVRRSSPPTKSSKAPTRSSRPSTMSSSNATEPSNRPATTSATC